ncbi:hypothetical protein WJX77_010639 [Trebouxia sp. C0004]
MNLRCRGPDGQTTLSGLDPEMTVAAFQELLASRLGVPLAYQELLAGFPPKSVQMPAEASSVALSSLMLANGDTLVVRRLPSSAAATHSAASTTAPSSAPTSSTEAAAAASMSTSMPEPQSSSLPHQGHSASNQESEDEQLARAIAASLGQATTSSSAAEAASQAAPQAGSSRGRHGSRTAQKPFQNGFAASASGSASTSVTLPDGSCVVRRKVDDDNSCLFSAVGYVMEGSRSHATKLRRVIADAVSADPSTYNDGFLGKSNAEYRAWILDPKKWGGAIELSIFARHFAREIAAYDIQTKRCDVYGQGEGYQERVMLIYDGLHYDALALAAFMDAPEELDVTITEQASQQAAGIERASAALTDEANKARQFTDTASFTLRCGTCKIGVKGEKEALEHAKTTGHANFSEYH